MTSTESYDDIIIFPNALESILLLTYFTDDLIHPQLVSTVDVIDCGLTDDALTGTVGNTIQDSMESNNFFMKIIKYI